MTLRITPAELVQRAEDSGQPGLLARAPHWSRVRLGDIAQVINGAAFSSLHFNADGVGKPIIRIRDVGVAKPSTWYSGPWEREPLVRRGDILVSMDGDFRVDRWLAEEALLNQRVCKIEVNSSRYDERFLCLVLPAYLDAIWSATSSTTVKHLSSRSVADIPLPMPSLDEQHRIVEELEDHSSRLNGAMHEISRALAKARNLDLSAISGARRRLLETSVPLVRLGEICETSLGKMLDAKRATGIATPYLRNVNVRWRAFDLSDVKSVQLTHAEIDRLQIVDGDIMVCEGGEPGRCAVWAGGSQNLAFQKALHRVRVKDAGATSPTFIALMIEEAVRSGRANRLLTGTTIKHLPQEKLKLIEIPRAAFEEQGQIVSQLDRLFASRARMVADANRVIDKCQVLRRSLLQEALNGHLPKSSLNLDVTKDVLSV